MDNSENNEEIRILVIEDNPADIRIIQEVFKDFKIKTQLYISRDGIEALDFLNKNGKYKDMPCPDLILLNLSLPRKNGMELLKDIKKDTNLKEIPVIVLTTSNAEEDILNAYKLQANCFITQPIDFDEYKNVLESIEEFWLKTAKLPRKDS